MKRRILTLSAIFLLVFSQQLIAQLISADPVFPTDQSQVVITFDATKGNAGLKNYTGDVYAHTGVITNLSQSGSDWKHVVASWTTNLPKAKMTRIAPNLYTLTIGPSIRQYYNVPASEQILQMAFVFRSASPVGGSYLEGKTELNGDIFYDVYEHGLQVVFIEPDKKQVLAEIGDSVPIRIAAIDADSISLFLNQQKLSSTTSSQLNYLFVASDTGNYEFKAKAYGNNNFVEDSTQIYVRPPITVENLPPGMIDGVNRLSDSAVLVSLFAPEKQFAFLIGDFNNWSLDQNNYMKRTPDGKRYWLQINKINPEREYAYQFFIDGQIRVADPYSQKILDPWNDAYIPPSTYPNLKPYPVGKTSGIVSVMQTNPEPYNWQITDFQGPPAEELIIYELLVRDFVANRDIKSVRDTLDYLQRLGVNAIELMPINEFEGNDSWGYNPAFYFAPDKAYGTMNDYKAFIDECHRRGMAVIVDMVLNHSFGLSPMVQMYMGANGQVAPNNPWYNVSCPHPPYCWGYDFNHQSVATQEFVDRVNRYWLQEFKVDGFRFDFTKGFTNKSGDGYSYDASRIALLKRMADQIWAVKNNAYVILEHFTANTEEKELANYGMMLWGNVTNAYNQSTMGYLSDSDFSNVSYKKRGWENPHLVGYMESHDEERLMYKNKKYGNNSNSYHNPRNLNIAVKRNAAAAAMFFLVPGPKMIWQFGELAYDYGINHCPDGSYNEGCRTSAKPVRWDYQLDWNRRLLFHYYRNLIALRKSHEVFKTSDFNISANTLVKTLSLKGQEMDAVVVANFDVEPRSAITSFSSTGYWYSYFSGDSLQVSDGYTEIVLGPGEFRVYTTKKLLVPDFVGLDEVGERLVPQVNIFPNPASQYVVIELTTDEPFSLVVDVLSFDGRVLQREEKGVVSPERLNRFKFETNRLKPGVYLIRLDTGMRYITKRLIVR
ncbi:MAG: T9SS type A sorting domain-containing protein [Bacteroidales bacterium]|nr:T9SS type A sorting domain-containing protein [Bacteroidales bacterium]